MGKLILTKEELALTTRRNTPISNEMNRRAPDDGAYLDQKSREGKPSAVRRYVGPCHTYDCHGLTFGSRRTNVDFDVETILEEDDYTEVSRKDALPGDITIYWSTPDPSKGFAQYAQHSGIVLQIIPFDGFPALNDFKILSKWGFGDEWVHNLTECPYNAGNVKFYRINDDPRNKVRRFVASRKPPHGGKSSALVT